MPVSFNSPARNLFLLGSSGADAVTNFFKTIDKSSNPNEGQFFTSQIKYNYSDQKYLLSGTGLGNDSFGWVEKRDYDVETDPDNPTSTEEWGFRINPTVYSSALTLTTIELDSNNDIIVVGKAGGVNGDYGAVAPYVAKYSNAGVIQWSSTSYSADVEYKNVTSDSNNEYYASGNTTSYSSNSVSFIEKFDVDGSPLWGKSAIVLGRDIELNGIAVNDRSQVVSVGWLEDDSRTKGYIVKVDTSSGTVLWDKTLVSSEKSGLIFTSTVCEDVFIDTQDNIYVVGKLDNANDSSTKSFIIKLSPEGNIIWQKETDENIEYYRVKADGDTGQVVTFGRYYDSVGNDQGGLITKYTRGGNISWRRTIFSSFNGSDFFGSGNINGGAIGLDADASFYYVVYNDSLGGQDPTAYTFGKVSTSGNGLGGFEYDDGESETVYYDILNVTEKIGRLSDGSVRNDTSDLITYPFSATKIAFDDFATPVANKKRQMDSADSFEYSGSPAIRVADFQEMNLLGDAGIPETMPVELITNGDFNSSNVTGWSPATLTADLRYSYNNSYNGTNSLIIVNYAAADSFIQSFTTEIGRPYKVSLDQLGGPVIKIFDGSGVSGTTLQTITTTNSGNYETGETGTFVATSTTSTFAVFDIPPGAAYVLDNISVQKDVLGPELITNGGFENDNIDGWTLDQNGGNVLAFYSSGYTGSRSVSLQNLGGSGDPKFYQSFVTEPGKTYYITLQQAGSPTFTIFDGSGLSGTTLRRMTTANTGSVAFDEEAYFKAASSTSTIAITSFGSGAYLMDDISVKEAPITLLWDDQSGKDNSGAIFGATHNADGYWEFDGTSTSGKHIDVDLSTDLIASNFSLEFWFRGEPNAAGTAAQFIAQQGRMSLGNGDGNAAWRIERNNSQSGTIEFNVNNGSGFNQNELVSTNFPDNIWHHCVCTYNNGYRIIYKNGVRDVQSSSFTGTASSPHDDMTVRIGARADSSLFGFNGRIGEFRIYPRVLTLAQVFQNYNATKTKYIYEAPSTAPLITSDNLSSTSSLLLNYDFGNRATYDPVVNKFTSSANLLKYSDGTASGRLTDWSWLGASTPEAIPNAAIAPDGSLTAWKVSGPSLYQSIINDGDFTMSAWVKTVDGSSASVQQSVYLLGTGGDVLSTTHTATGEWQRITFSSVATSIYGNPAGKYHRYTPFSSSADLYVWGPQVELKSSAGRHVQTYGTAINLSYGFNSLVPYAGNGTFNDEPKNQFIDGTVKCNGTYEFITFSYPSVTVSDGSSSTVSWTAEFWIKPDAFTGSSDIGDLLSDGTYKIQLEQGGSDAGKIRYNYSSTASGFSNVALTAGQWNHVVVKFSPFAAATSVSIQSWINNTFALNTGHTEPLQQIANRFGNGFKGRLAELRIYDTDLTDTAREANWNATRGKYGV
jgi:hypothetical protein